jgi:predicted component of type VI protein secretion system|tara:strand:- start:605 stop:739 length:135 start_codon:yes stop_codon:yes gene_type:complete
MKYFLFVILFLLYACESANVPKEIKKKRDIQMKVTTEPSIKVKK